jgi:hypothetical protein
MLRRLYIWLLRLHPATFRQRFGDEMLEIFDTTTGLSATVLLTADGLISLLRQWAFRSEFRRPFVAVAPFGRHTDVPLFSTIDTYKPRPLALFQGGLLTVFILWAAVGMMGKGGSKARGFLIGAHHSSPHLLPVARGSVAQGELNSTVKLPEPQDPWRPIAAVYFKVIRVLNALDADHDLAISRWEMFTAPGALRTLDRNHDGKLSAEECGFFPEPQPGIPPDVVNRARGEFMRLNPVLATLDADHDGEISASEIADSSSALRNLDRNGDGILTPDELIPSLPQLRRR